ncbi:hypothetical protein AYL99_11704 [Fonsecaea erecta]|uniref:Uncharacterized protein n=1 Tax=Fonsecaea erecta TaxID=1367422 RepID=A0A178Z2Z1_9EURO|nr:hypothetical protein AYL99_11704 [Fonsecaea erecta]OAP54169.1 hypothetical protein AYL99_11704 [Fonsecaea erecta]
MKARPISPFQRQNSMGHDSKPNSRSRCPDPTSAQKTSGPRQAKLSMAAMLCVTAQPGARGPYPRTDHTRRLQGMQNPLICTQTYRLGPGMPATAVTMEGSGMAREGISKTLAPLPGEKILFPLMSQGQLHIRKRYTFNPHSIRLTIPPQPASLIPTHIARTSTKPSSLRTHTSHQAPSQTMASPAEELQATLPNNLTVKTLSVKGRLPTFATKVSDIEDQEICQQVFDKYIAYSDKLCGYRVDMGGGYIYMCQAIVGEDNYDIHHDPTA